jgi:nitrile hydratase
MSDDHTNATPVGAAAARAAALEALLVRKGIVATDVIDAVVDTFEREVGPQLGARAVARAWVDPDFKARLLADGTAGLSELGIGGIEGENVRVVENTDDVHNAVVCTLCSCYPWPVLGTPPVWYKSAPYRSRVVREPRVVLAEMGLDLPEATSIRVWDSSAHVRYLVLPKRPAGTDGLDEAQLAELVTRDCMIGVAVPSAP